jgi:ferric-dicitrate binding protein FerR (iron transport regulator)
MSVIYIDEEVGMKRNLFFFILGFLLANLSLVHAQATNDSVSDPVEYAVEDIQGSNVQVLENNSQTWDQAQEGQVLESGDEIRTGDNSEATLTMQSETQVHLSANSDLKVGQIAPNTTNGFLSHLVVLAGVILSDVKKNLLESHSSFEIEANGVVCAVRGTAFEVSNNNGDVETATHEGKVETLSGGESHFVAEGSAASFKNSRYQSIRQLRTEEINRFQRWRSVRMRIRNKRMQRIRDIRMGRRQAWARRHGRAMMQRRRMKNRRRFNRS